MVNLKGYDIDQFSVIVKGIIEVGSLYFDKGE